MTYLYRAGFLAGAALLASTVPSAAAEPVNGRIAYSTFESSAGAAGDIWTMRPDGGGREQAVFDVTDDAQSDWSPDGTKIAFRSRRNNRFEVSIVDFTVRDAATGRPRITHIPTAPDGTQSSQPAWYPDMSRLLYRRSSTDPVMRSDVWTMKPDGSDRRPLLVASGDQFYPSLSPDMSTLLFSTVVVPNGRNIQAVDMATGIVRTVFEHSVESYDSAPA